MRLWHFICYQVIMGDSYQSFLFFIVFVYGGHFCFWGRFSVLPHVFTACRILSFSVPFALTLGRFYVAFCLLRSSFSIRPFLGYHPFMRVSYRLSEGFSIGYRWFYVFRNFRRHRANDHICVSFFALLASSLLHVVTV